MLGKAFCLMSNTQSTHPRHLYVKQHALQSTVWSTATGATILKGVQALCFIQYTGATMLKGYATYTVQ